MTKILHHDVSNFILLFHNSCHQCQYHKKRIVLKKKKKEQSTETSHERVSAIETIVQHLYWLTNFYRLIMSTGISPTLDNFLNSY